MTFRFSSIFRFKSSNGGNPTSTTEATPVEPTQRTRGRFGGSSNGGGFKRPRPGQKTSQQQPVEEDAVQKESVGSVAAEKPNGSASRGRFRSTVGSRSVSTTSAPTTGTSSGTNNGSPSAGPSGISRPSFNKLNINRKRGRPTAAPSTTSQSGEDSQEEIGQSPTAESATVSTQSSSPLKPAVRSRLPGPGSPGGTGRLPIVRPPAGRLNLRQKPGQATTLGTSTTSAPEEVPEGSVEEPAGEGTEEETHEVSR